MTSAATCSGEARLAHSANSRDGHQRAGAQCLPDLDQLEIATDERRDLDGEVAAEGVERAHGREVACEIGVDDLEDTDRAGQVAQPVLTEVDEIDAMIRVAQQLLGGERHEDLAAVGDTHQPRRPVQRGAVVVAVATVGRSGVDPHAHTQLAGLAPRLGRERTLRIERRTRSVRLQWRRHACAPSPVILTTYPSCAVDRVAQDLVVTRERGLHRLGVLLPETRRALEVGEQERDRAGRQLSGHR